MKNFLIFSSFLIFILFSFLIIGNKYDNKDDKSISVSNIDSVDIEYAVDNDINEIRGIYVSYIELNKYIKDKDEKSSKNNIISILDNIKKYNFNLLILQVRPFSDAIYESKIYPLSDTIKNYGKTPNYDVLQFVISEAKKRNISIHAWINPYRITNSSNTDIKSIKSDSPAYKLIKNECVKSIKDKGIYYNPACSEVTNLIVDGIKELINNYEIDGIQFDDYFYPDKEIDLNTYKTYIENGGVLPLNKYRYENILNMIENVNSSIKSTNKNILFGIAPDGNIDNNYDIHFLDIKTILSSDKYIDYVMPQLYYGFDNQNKPFIKTLETWNSYIKSDNISLIPALAFYKSGNSDKYAGTGYDEWINNDDIISRQIIESRNVSQYKGFSLFRYDYIFNNVNKQSKNELKNINDILNKI